ncbi:hypothetical protein LDENG_00160630 [Lucifuga dentata]|nr:hypothetical protein LDENG_00160630 [Lucifuga dentata]
MHDLQPYSAALQALQDKYGQPRQLVQSELGALLSTPALKMGDANAFALSVQSLVGMLRTLEGQNGYELMCGSHVDRLLSKMLLALRDSFVEYCLIYKILKMGSDKIYTLPDLATWLQIKSQANRTSSRAAALFQSDPHRPVKKDQGPTPYKEWSTPVLLMFEGKLVSAPMRSKAKLTLYCPHCDNQDHYLNSCDEFKKLNTSQIVRLRRARGVGNVVVPTK